MDRYVTEIALPAPVFMSLDERKKLNEPGYYGCRRAYWAIDSEMDELGTPQPIGIRLTAELEAVDLESAEDTALQLGLRFSQVLAAYSGSPLLSPRLKRLARVGDSDGLFEQYDYYYLDGPDALPRVLLRPHDLDRLLSWFGRLDEPTVYRLELAARWYGMSVGAQDPLDGFLAVWIGLESVGPAFGARMHEHGPKVSCNICGNQAGVNRNKGEAGMEHAIKGVAPELLKARSLSHLKNLRHDIAHGRKPAQPLRIEAEQSLPDLQLALLFAILTTARPQTSAPRSGRGILPRNFKLYPDARSEVRSQIELIKHKPFFGEWLEVDRKFSNLQSRLESDGNYIWGATTVTQVKGWIPTAAPKLERAYVIFERMGRSWENPESDEEHPSIPVVPWRTVSLSPAWERHLMDQAS